MKGEKPTCYNRKDYNDKTVVQDGWVETVVNGYPTRVPRMKEIAHTMSKECMQHTTLGEAVRWGWNCEGCRHLPGALSVAQKEKDVLDENNQKLVNDAPALSSHNRKRVSLQGQCGCFFCMRTFASSDIKEWVDDNQTALCPHCDTDSVLPGVTDTAVLTVACERWFTEKSEGAA